MERQKNITPTLLEKFTELHRRNVASYGIISLNPPIFFTMRYPLTDSGLITWYQILFDFLKNTKSYFVCCWGGEVETQAEVLKVKRIDEAILNSYPNLNIAHVCNTLSQLELFQKNGLRSIFCNHNCLIDENIFKPISTIEKNFEAVYDARFIEWKRHYLAEEIEKLALIYYSVSGEDPPEFIAEIKQKFKPAHFFNHDDIGNYRILTPTEVNQCLNYCRVGLCLSSSEGAMYASIQYLLSGLPVVSTENTGGRNEFFAEDYVRIVKADKYSVKEAVKSLIEQNISPEMIRTETLKKIRQHRERFIALIQEIYDEAKCERNFNEEWSKVFFNRLYKYQSHLSTIEELKGVIEM